MVVTRRTSVPMPPTSRTSSSQATPKVDKGKTPQTSPLGHETDETLLNGNVSLDDAHIGPQDFDEVLFSDGSPPRKAVKDRTKVKTKRRDGRTVTRRKKRPASWLDLFSRVFILAFLIYSLSVCPTADKQKSPVCRALSEYRRLVLEPYVITPVQNLLHHPSVSPYTTPVINQAQPIIARTRHEWNSRVVPQWKVHVVPQWEKHVVPLWDAHVSPQLSRLEAKIDPYRQQVAEHYEKHAARYVDQVRAVAYEAQPYILLAVARTYDSYQASRPYFARAYKELQRVPPIFVEYAIRPLASARRQYVDPHVAVLMEKMQELSSGTTKSNAIPDNETTSSVVDTTTFTKEAEGAAKSVEVELPVASESTGPDATLASASSIVSASLSLETSTSKTSSSAEPGKESESMTPVSSVVSASLIPGDEATESVPGATYSPTPKDGVKPEVLLGQVKESESESKVEPKSKYFEDHGDSQETVVAQGTETENLKASSASAEESDDLDDLLAELGLDVEETVSGEPPATPSVHEETEEVKAAREAKRIAENAEKRRELEGRHAKWEEKLFNTIKAQKDALKDALTSIRRTGAAELKINLAIRAAIETLHSESEKALRGTDAYFTKLRAGGKPLAEQARLWDRVLDKVEAKFEERVHEVEETVNKWYQEEVLSKEMQEIEKASGAVQTVADDAQADIGLDYAWLDDVTYLDWRRYHALLDKHREFLHEQLSLANGSHPNAYPNPVLDAFEDLQSEVHDITLGFETRMRRIKREGERAFTEQQSETEETAAPPEVSVLPIEDNGKKEDKAFQEVADAILGRSEEEVGEALGRAEEQVKHEEL